MGKIKTAWMEGVEKVCSNLEFGAITEDEARYALRQHGLSEDDIDGHIDAAINVEKFQPLNRV